MKYVEDVSQEIVANILLHRDIEEDVVATTPLFVTNIVSYLQNIDGIMKGPFQ